MISNELHNGINLLERGYSLNPDWNRNFREDQDKITRVIDRVIDMELSDYIRTDTMLSDVYFTKYWGWVNYCLVYKIKERYNNIGILIGAILESTDEVLKWYDLTTKFNFNIIIVTPYETFRFTYLDLLYEYVTMSDGNGRFTSVRTLLNTHPRIQLMKEWVTRYREYERVTQKTVFSNHPYSTIEKNGEVGEFLKLRNDNKPTPQEYRGLGKQPGYSDYSRGGEDFYQRVQQISQYYNGGYRQEEQSNLTVTQRVKKESLITRLKNNLKW
jgi:hypothetical protein